MNIASFGTVSYSLLLSSGVSYWAYCSIKQKELIYGYDGGDFQFAFSLDDARTFGGEVFEINGQQLSIEYNQEHEFAYLVGENGEQLPTHNGLFRMVWSHWFSETITLNG
ncbi:hypothetical protein SNR37_003180 [Agarivorans aestuarii]|uniref:Uncharacterized protein n=1 Tax=Agarivorans aestuarii TaxID=1563703 RepID=A0ABU7G2Y0_9ALTE|nr:hypothetical protein [Agarivorans aestuarii]MEE1673753.1 hypothetical protein [Agarivorans aestuarii]